jgi:DNA-binding response OmpR family regulator
MPMTGTVLLAEDEPHIVESLRFLLGRAGFDVMVATSGDVALDTALGARPDVLVLDVMMPGMNGFEVLRRLRAEPACAHLPVIVLTAKSQREDRETARAAGADVFMTKPFSNNELVETVSRLAGQRVR